MSPEASAGVASIILVVGGGLCALLALVCAPALALGGAADPLPIANVVVSDSGFRDADATDPTDRTVDIVVGGRVNFSYPAGTGEYNVVWDRGSLEPATCVQTAGPVWGYGTTLPWWTQRPGWAGYCTFTAPGTYTYHSGVNPDGLKGTVVVHAEGTPTATPTVTATPTATPTTAPTTAKVSAHDTARESVSPLSFFTVSHRGVAIASASCVRPA